MRTITSIPEMTAAAEAGKASGKTIGFVPTMGYLHQGHLSLVRESRRTTGLTVVSIFVNPLQFGPNEDFKAYPRDPARDSGLLEQEGVDILFCPEAGEMYPPEFRTSVEVRGLQDRLCGASRPGHFQGVGTVVLKLFDIVRPDSAFFGQKDAQQVVIIKRLAADLNLPVTIEVGPIVREADGLAMSSRNTYLSPDDRRAARVLWRSLEAARQSVLGGELRTPAILERMGSVIGAEPLARVDYLAAVSPVTLEPVEQVDGAVLFALAVFIGRTRLIDNVLLGPPGHPAARS
jgi:pantoate--beta-alanine ligase